MGIVDVSGSFGESVQQKAGRRLSELLESIEGLSEGPRFGKLADLFNEFFIHTNACLENFKTDEFKARENDQKTNEVLEHMIKGAQQGAEILNLLQEKISQCPQSHTNGTASIAAECLEKEGQVQIDLFNALKVYEQEMERRRQRGIPIHPDEHL